MENKNCKKCKQEFTLDANDLGFYQKMKVPSPNVCPDCRFKMRAMFRNETTLYSGRKCALCNKSVISSYNPSLLYTVYCHSCFYSEKWNPDDYAMDYDENKTFIEQFKELLLKVPKMSTYLTSGSGQNVNSEYVNYATSLKNCYMVFNAIPAEDLMYSRGIRGAKNSADLYFALEVERCYEVVNVQQSYGIIFGQNVSGSVDSAFVLNCRGVMNCFGCVNLNNKSHYFLNQPMEQEEYKKKVAEIMGSYEKMEEFKKQFEKFVLDFPMRENNNLKTVNSSGDYLFECKDVKDSFEASKAENSRFIHYTAGVKDSMDVIGYGTKSEKLLETVGTGFSSNVIATYGAENCSDILYGFYIRNCKDCIGCDAIHNGKYAILNKRYSKEEYDRLRGKIIAELTELGLYGLMMPPELAPWAYNETVAQDNFPMTKEEALSLGFNWRDNLQKTEGKETLKPEEIKDNINEIDESILAEVLACIECSRNYRITETELLFYQKMNIPIPRKCFYCRHKNRITKRGPLKFWNRECMKCGKAIVTNYDPKRPEIVYCENCYKQEVY